MGRLKLLVSVCTFTVILLLGGCLSSGSGDTEQRTMSTDIAPGTVLVDVRESGEPEHYWQYQVQPARGVVRATEELQFPNYKHRDVPKDFQRPAGVIDWYIEKPQADSPDGRLFVYCERAAPDELHLVDRQSNQQVHSWKSGHGIRGFAWAPNSGSVAVLTVSGHVGLRPAELLALLSGHPVSHDTVFLDIVDVRSGKATEYVIRRNVVAPFTRILSWAE